ncbi:TPA: YeeE/YedE thiosulfate transporter family protein [Stenotrophomonas maltophilia]|uniref:YeeE/YedE family protein n=1 Tax=Stenotrophomonas maltophilia TaxID=40324 RepID=A0AAI9G486_STEMA|nr:YeeE/YedE thiosulfate transporter family protein [Stenotrophomonas maltophilia]EKZ1926802.1 YeeE/YedE family protein [Stenotrophomonas maltophilia]EMB2745965.1 YeeE/YedE family protein [Stenotrophomonas maltophilia]MBH1416848.1 YeeE/YedE family protein [Stenotrophomonas maltophilia]MBH1446917.1 YeeE/YedE family protein [Stenotrophomonas maltophilia]MBH1686215.1 YeeE/YedE family protein [Stenotrophomonas maltophilia]
MMLTPLAWYWPLIGGLMIGTAAGAYLVFTGRIAGISGLIANTLGLSAGGDRSLAALFLAGLLVTSGVALAVKPISLPSLSSSTTPLLILAGLLVGYGTRLGSGCTSGHGVCGLARLSPRSMVATVAFMLMGMATVALVPFIVGAGT